MRIRPSWLILALLLIPTAAHADDHKADLFGGPSGARGSSLWGFQVTGALTLPVPGLGRNLAAIGDFSAHIGSRDEEDLISFLVGARLALAKGHESHVVPFAQVMFGRVHYRDGDGSGGDGAVVVGGGLDFLVTRTEDSGGWGLRAEVDRVWRVGDAHDLVRVSGGLFVRWGRQAS